jgi:hypothetical protein
MLIAFSVAVVRLAAARIPTSVRAFFLDEAGALPITVGYLMVTMAVSIPLGLALYSIYVSLCVGGEKASFLLGLS